MGREEVVFFGKKTPLYSGGKDPTVTHLFSPRHAVLPHRLAVLLQELTVLPLGRAVLPLAWQRLDEGPDVYSNKR